MWRFVGFGSQDLEPLSLIDNSLMGQALYYAHRYERAIGELRKSLELDPNFAQTHLFLGWAYEQLGRYDDAITELHRSITFGGESQFAGPLGHALAVSGKRVEAEKVLLQLKQRSTEHYVAPFDIAVVYAGLGARTSAFEWLDKAYEDHSARLTWIKVDPRLDGIRNDPRYHDLLRRMNMPE
jgi:Flp pilus assembly protein TadD